MASKPVFTPTQSSTGNSGYNPLAARSRSGVTQNSNVDEDGWGQDAPPITRTQLEKVQSSYQPTKVDLRGTNSQSSAGYSPAPAGTSNNAQGDNSVVKGAYQPVGKVDIAELRRQAQRDHSDDRPTPVKGAYEPVGKVDIAAIRSRAQPPTNNLSGRDSDVSAATQSSEPRQSLPDRSAPFNTSERLTSLPKPKVASRFGSNTSSFTGTKASTPGGFGLDSKSTSNTSQAGIGRTFADQGGKTPAQIWAEKKARERGLSGASETAPSSDAAKAAPPITSQTSGGGEWRSGYSGKSWAPIETTRTGHSASSRGESSAEPQHETEREDPAASSGGVNAIRDRFRNDAPAPPALDMSNKPNAGRGVPIPGLPTRPSQTSEEPEEASHMPSPPPQPPRSPTPPTPPAVSGSPIRVAMPVGKSNQSPNITDASEELASPPPMPSRSLADAVPREDELADEASEHHAARGAAEATAAASFGQHAVDTAQVGAQESGKRALVQYDYEKAEDNEIELKEGDYVTHIEMVDENWWMGQNAKGESGLFPSNYVELAEDEKESPKTARPEPPAPVSQGNTAIALYDYEAAEDNELSFPENAQITEVVRESHIGCVRLLTRSIGISR